MTIPFRGETGRGTYFVTASMWMKKRLLQSQRSAELLIEMLYQYRSETNYSLHEFVVMPHHFHLLLTPLRPITLEAAVGMIKGAFSYQAASSFRFTKPIWQPSFMDRRVRNHSEYQRFRTYIHENPVKAHLAAAAQEFPFSSASEKFELDPVPLWLKPLRWKHAAR
ncbi:MAG TPA: transposase [Terriglobales bacterium]